MRHGVLPPDPADDFLLHLHVGRGARPHPEARVQPPVCEADECVHNAPVHPPRAEAGSKHHAVPEVHSEEAVLPSQVHELHCGQYETDIWALLRDHPDTDDL